MKKRNNRPSKKELGQLYPINIYDYDDNWPNLFKKEKTYLQKILGSKIAISFEHIGSTAVPGFPAKPTIDILVEISPKDEKTIKEILKNHGYVYMTEQDKHLMFVKGYTPQGLAKESFHIHMGPRDLDWLWDRIYFRDYLCDNPETAKEYKELKYKLSEKFKNDREAYTQGKADFIIKITDIAKSTYCKNK